MIVVALAAVIFLDSVFLVHRFKKPWFYYLAVVISTGGALFYAWPR